MKHVRRKKVVPKSRARTKRETSGRAAIPAATLTGPGRTRPVAQTEVFGPDGVVAEERCAEPGLVGPGLAPAKARARRAGDGRRCLTIRESTTADRFDCEGIITLAVAHTL